MEDIVNRLRGFKSAAAQSWAHEAADEIEYLRAQLAEERQQKHEALHREYCRREELNTQLLATQAHAARLKEVIRCYGAHKVKCASMVFTERGQYEHMSGIDCDCGLEAALSTPINLDALHEALAKECERLATICKAKSDELYNRNSRMQHHTGAGTGCDLCADICKKEAAVHRAKKDSHQ